MSGWLKALIAWAVFVIAPYLIAQFVKAGKGEQ